jgi:hypothetical protein
MKTKLFAYLCVIAALSQIIACDDGMPENVQFDNFMSVYLIPAQNANKNLSLYGARDTTLTFAGIRYGGSSAPVGTVTAGIAIDLSMVAAYNEANGTSYLPIPETCASLDKTTLTIPDNDFASDLFTLSINDRNLLEVGSTYLIPIKVSSVSGANLTLNEALASTYVILSRRIDPTDLLRDLSEHLKGHWTFDNTDNLFAATVGEDLIPGYGNFILYGDFTYDYHDITSIGGPSGTNLAVNIPDASWLQADHNIGGNGGGSNVNEYTIMMDVRTQGAYYAPLYQTDLTNDNEAEMFINGAKMVIYQHPYYNDPIDLYWESATNPMKDNTWQRIILAVSLPTNTYSVYVDGVLIETFSNDAFAVDASYSLDPVSVMFCADYYGWPVDVAEIRIWDFVLTEDHIGLLGDMQ